MNGDHEVTLSARGAGFNLTGLCGQHPNNKKKYAGDPVGVLQIFPGALEIKNLSNGLDLLDILIGDPVLEVATVHLTNPHAAEARSVRCLDERDGDGAQDQDADDPE